MSEKEWLVEIRVKDWIATPNRVVGYEEVVAHDELSARMSGYDQFAHRVKYEPIMRRRFQALGLKLTEVCAPDAVEI